MKNYCLTLLVLILITGCTKEPKLDFTPNRGTRKLVEKIDIENEEHLNADIEEENKIITPDVATEEMKNPVEIKTEVVVEEHPVVETSKNHIAEESKEFNLKKVIVFNQEKQIVKTNCSGPFSYHVDMSHPKIYEYIKDLTLSTSSSDKMYRDNTCRNSIWKIYDLDKQPNGFFYIETSGNEFNVIVSHKDLEVTRIGLKLTNKESIIEKAKSEIGIHKPKEVLEFEARIVKLRSIAKEMPESSEKNAFINAIDILEKPSSSGDPMGKAKANYLIENYLKANKK